jgi:predicted TIM-barrel fold metal-dependent hydrolase
MIIDSHAHYGDWYFPLKNPSADETSLRMKKLGIDMTVFSSSLGIVYDFREGNAELAKVLGGHPEFSGYVAVNLNYPKESLAELDAYLAAPGPRRFVGIKIHPMLDGRSFDSPAGLLFAEAAGRYGVPILIHTFGSAIESPRNILKAAGKFPKAKFILGHMGGYDWEAGIEVAKACPQAWLEICSTCTDMRKIRAAIDAVGAGRLLFGTDSTLFAPEYTLGALLDMGLSGQERSMLMGENAQALFGFAR